MNIDIRKPTQHDCEPGRGWISPGDPLHVDHESIVAMSEKKKEEEKENEK